MSENKHRRPLTTICFLSAGVCFHCVIDVVPVKNEDGLVIMFILNFELPTDPRPTNSSPAKELNRMLRMPWLTMGKIYTLLHSLTIIIDSCFH